MEGNSQTIHRAGLVQKQFNVWHLLLICQHLFIIPSLKCLGDTIETAKNTQLYLD